MVHISKYYDKERPPSQILMGGSKVTSRKTDIQATVMVLDIINIDETHSLISLDFILTLQWIDPNIKFNFLKDDQAKNVIEPTALENIWKPEFKFSRLKNTVTNIDG